MIQDAQGRWWMIGYETGQWYVHDGGGGCGPSRRLLKAGPTATTAPPDSPVIPGQGQREVAPRPQAQLPGHGCG